MKREWQRRLDFFLGGEGYSPFERLHHGFLILGSLFFLFAGIQNLLFDLTPLWYALGMMSFSPLFWWFWWRSAKKGELHRYLPWVAALIYLALLCNWFFNAGSKGPTLFFFFTSILYIIFSSPPRSLFTRTFIGLLILSPVVLISIEAFFPSWILPYPSEEERLLDLMLSYLLTATLVGILIAGNVERFRQEMEREKESQREILIEQTKLAELGSLMGALTHQWKQPLHAISLMTQTLEELQEHGELDEEAIREHTTRIYSQIRFMDETLENFRHFYKPSPKERRLFSPFVSIKRVIHLLDSSLRPRNLEVLLEGEERLEVMGYPNDFEQVILNLLNNAKEAFESQGALRGKILIKERLTPYGIEITLEDDAGGIDPELLPEKIFEPFTTTKGAQGTGIGMSLAKTIIEEKMGGRIRAQNLALGACFTLLLPLTPWDIHTPNPPLA